MGQRTERRITDQCENARQVEHSYHKAFKPNEYLKVHLSKDIIDN